MWTFLNFIGKKVDGWLAPSPLGRGVSGLLAILMIAFSLWYGYARYTVREEAQREVEERVRAIELQKAINQGRTRPLD